MSRQKCGKARYLCHDEIAVSRIEVTEDEDQILEDRRRESSNSFQKRKAENGYL